MKTTFFSLSEQSKVLLPFLNKSYSVQDQIRSFEPLTELIRYRSFEPLTKLIRYRSFEPLTELIMVI